MSDIPIIRSLPAPTDIQKVEIVNQELLGVYKKMDDNIPNPSAPEPTQEYKDYNRKEEKNNESFRKKLASLIPDSMKQGMAQGSKTLGKEAFGALLGPLQLITNPLEDLMGGSLFDMMGDAFKGAKEKFRGSPNRQKVLPIDPGAVYIGDKIDDANSEGANEEGGSWKDKLLGMLGIGSLAGLLPKLLKGGAIAAIIGSVIWAVVDGIRAMVHAEEWGVRKFSAFVGGFLGGSAEGGIKNAFKNAGKFALMGAGIGFLVGSIPGALIGGLVGAALGGILGWIGAEKLAKGVDKAVDWVQKTWASFKEKIWEPVKNFFVNLFKSLSDYIVEKFNVGKEIWQGDGTIWEKIKATFTDVLLPIVGDYFKMVGNAIKTIVTTGIDIGLKALGWINDNLIPPVVDFFVSVKSKITEAVTTKIEDIKTWVSTYIFDPIMGVFTAIADWWENSKLKTFVDVLTGKKWTDKEVADMEEGRRQAMQDGMKAAGIVSYPGSGYTGGGGNPLNVKDALIRNDGSVIIPDPNDNILFTKQTPLVTDGIKPLPSNPTLSANDISSILSYLKRIADKELKTEHVIIPNGGSSQYESDSIMNRFVGVPQ